MAAATTSAAADGAALDGGLYRTIADWGDGLPDWAASLVRGFTDYGLILFPVLMVLAWLVARRGPARSMARALAAPVATALAYGVNKGLKALVEEDRPCRAARPVRTLLHCPPHHDWSFPSNHSVIAGAAAVALLLAVGGVRGGGRTVAALAVLGALAMGASRVVVGVHYPHDVWAGWLVGAILALLVGGVAGLAAGVVERRRGTRWRLLFGPGLRW